MLVCGLKRNTDHERQKTHDRTEVQRIAEDRWRQKHREGVQGVQHPRDHGDDVGSSKRGGSAIKYYYNSEPHMNDFAIIKSEYRSLNL